MLLLSSLGGHRDTSQRPLPALPAPAGPIVSGRPTAVTIPAAQLAIARQTGRRFLAVYLPYLYGRARVTDIPAVDGHVATALRSDRPRVTPAQRQRRPRLRDLTLAPQTRRSIQATARVSDGGIAPYALSFTLERRGGRWLVSDLASD